MKAKSPVMVKHVTIEEYFLQENNKVFRMWRFAGKGDWNKEPTPYEKMPIVYFNL